MRQPIPIPERFPGAETGYQTPMAGVERLLVPLVLTAVAAYLSPGLAAFCGSSLLVIWGLVELIGLYGSRFHGHQRR
jgi:hypothetical protein